MGDAGTALSRRAADLIERFEELERVVRGQRARATCQIGTLGGGNHFIEVCLDTENAVWILLHSGSRHIGAALAVMLAHPTRAREFCRARTGRLREGLKGSHQVVPGSTLPLMSHPLPLTEERALSTLIAHGADPNFARRMLESLRAAGISLADEQRNELSCRWVNVQERAVPPEADTIIRTITRTVNHQSTTTTHWLDGLRSPPFPDR